jgi:hypothetical protein
MLAKKKELIKENSLRYSASNDFGKNFLGYKI